MLRGEEIELRPVRKTDSSILYQAINDADLVRFNSSYKPVDEINHERWLESVLIDPLKRVFIIQKAETAIGFLQLTDVNLLYRNAQLTIRLFSQDFCNKGVGPTAIKLICDHAVRDLGLVRIWLNVFENNLRAIRAYEKAGFKIEGCLKKAAYIDGAFVNILIMAIIFE